MRSTEFIRDHRTDDEPGIDALLIAAFGGPAEAALVHRLRKSKSLAAEKVLPSGDQIIGYYAMSALIAPKGWFALAPVAIHPGFQRQGHGRRMIAQLAEWARLARVPIVVLGQPDFYGKAGFSSANARNLKSDYPVDTLLLAGITDRAPQETLRYSPAFDGI